ncbi:hypothetical protein O6H91_13G064300 [Diphasiastrum complanatum]|uniref:Uncharacterized protein n=1 Tax=Diphasiastrum complanatum TaxID=34168 RepID=A0ACC2BVH6_DIPCM|nr:hypothetical protein O6H91_Y054000 [Diphasiastrum complanatum]KAJ7533778.1 hypothetical protein O6H91_13G064300 [Diphasiastrum complanatum]
MAEIQLVSKPSSDELLNKYPDVIEAEDMFPAIPSRFHLGLWPCESPRAVISPTMRNRRKCHAFVHPETPTFHSLWIEEEQVLCKTPLNPASRAGRALQAKSFRRNRKQRWVSSKRCASLYKKLIHSHNARLYWEKVPQEDDQSNWSQQKSIVHFKAHGLLKK